MFRVRPGPASNQKFAVEVNYTHMQLTEIQANFFIKSLTKERTDQGFPIFYK